MKFELCLQAFIRAVIDVSRDDDGVDFLADGEGDDILKCLIARLAESARQFWAHPGEALERAVNVQVGAMQEAEGTHTLDSRRWLSPISGFMALNLLNQFAAVFVPWETAFGKIHQPISTL